MKKYSLALSELRTKPGTTKTIVIVIVCLCALLGSAFTANATVAVIGFAFVALGGLVVFLYQRTVSKQYDQIFEAEQKITELSDCLRAVSNSVELGVWEYHNTQNELVWNEWMYYLHGQSPSAFKPTIDSWLALLPADHRSDIKTALLLCANKGEPFVNCYEFLFDNQPPRYLSIQAEAVLNVEGEPTRIVGTVQDITKQKQYEKELFEQRQQNSLATRAKSQYIASMSHEIRTPMNAILGAAELLDGSELDEQQRNHTALIRSSASGLLNVVNDIIELTKIETNKMHVELFEFDLQEMLQQTLANFKRESERKGLKLELQQDKELPQTVQADEVKIKKVLTKLLSNAIKFTHFGTVTLKVSFLQAKAPEQSHLAFSIIDTGKGMSEHTRLEIFEKFENFDTGRIKKFVGSGLSLHVCNQLVELMRGSLQVRSELDRGSEFILSVPVLAQTEQTCTNMSYTDTEISVDLRSKNILVVDDIESNRLIISHMLADTGANILFAKNGRQALDIYAHKQLDLIVMDILMPELDGIEATKSVRNTASPYSSQNVPIIGLTALETMGDREICMSVGMNAYLSKPVSRIELLTHIKKFVEQSDSVCT